MRVLLLTERDGDGNLFVLGVFSERELAKKMAEKRAPDHRFEWRVARGILESFTPQHWYEITTYEVDADGPE